MWAQTAGLMDKSLEERYGYIMGSLWESEAYGGLEDTDTMEVVLTDSRGILQSK